MSEVNDSLLQLLQAHGVEAILRDGWVTFPGRPMRANASIVGESGQKAGTPVQLDVRLEIAPRRVIVESFAGLGGTREEAVADALQNFAANSFHVLLAAFFRPGDRQDSRKKWVVGGRASRVTIGDIGVRGELPLRGERLFAWFRNFEERLRGKLKGEQLRPGTHWVRLYYAQMRGKVLVCEALLDNDVWEGMQAEMAGFDWPAGEPFYSVRLFAVIEVEAGGPVSPQTAVAWLAEIVAPRPKFTEDEVYAAMADAGVPEPVAGRAFKFTQAAWGRVFLDGLGVRFSADYVCFNAAGEVVESRLSADEPYFVAAMGLAPRYARSPGFLQLALMSADVHAVNNALNAGSRPEELVMGPAGLFLEPATPSGMNNARKVLSERARAAANAGD